MKTFLMKTADVQRKWWLVDADGLVLGRMATKLARILMGKNRPTYTPYVDGGDAVVIVNAEKVRVTGAKAEQREKARGYAITLDEDYAADVEQIVSARKPWVPRSWD